MSSGAVPGLICISLVMLVMAGFALYFLRNGFLVLRCLLHGWVYPGVVVDVEMLDRSRYHRHVEYYTFWLIVEFPYENQTLQLSADKLYPFMPKFRNFHRLHQKMLNEFVGRSVNVCYDPRRPKMTTVQERWPIDLCINGFYLFLSLGSVIYFIYLVVTQLL